MPDFDFLAPDYDAVYAARADRLSRLRQSPEIVAGVREHYREHPVDFINDFGMTFDPRNAEIGLPSVVPFVLFAKQAEFVDWVVARWRGREDGLVEKSRDMGVSWLCVAVAVWFLTFQPGTVVGFGSRKEEYVDKLGDPKSLFWKAREFIKLLPRELRPRVDAPHMRIVNLDSGSSIVGEAGDNIGRGNRTSIYFKDESAFYERPEAIEAALSQTSNCKIDVSTPNGNGNPFYRKRHAGKVPVFTFHWTDDPRKDQAWYDKQKRELDSVIVAQEIDIDYNASVSDVWIDGALVSAAQRNGPADIEPFGQWIVGVDAAHFGDDESIISPRRGRFSPPQTVLKGVDGTQLSGRVEEECRQLEAGGSPVHRIVVELDGPGVSCFDFLRRPGGPYRDRVQGVHTGARLSDGKNFNIKARMWRGARDHLLDKPCSLPNDPTLKSQLASVKYLYRDGLLLMEKKADYKKRLKKSPDRADAWVLTFAAAEQVAVRAKPAQRAGGQDGWMG